MQTHKARRPSPPCRIEALEDRTHFSVVDVSPGEKWVAAIHNSQAGDTMEFAPGDYTVASNTTLPARTYVGISGAALVGSSNLTFTGGDISGFIFDGVQLGLAGTQIVFHDNGLVGNTTLNLPASANNTQVVHNNFQTTSNFCVRGAPGDNVAVDYNSVDLSQVVGQGQDEEWLHLVSTCSGLSVSHNVITGNLMRWAIELQSGMQDLTVDGNYVEATAGGSGLSIAVGGDPTAPFANAGENVDVSGNVVIADSDPQQSCAVEIDGDKNIQVHDNYLSGFWWGITNGTGGLNNQGLITSNNTIVYRSSAYADGDNTPWKVPPRQSAGDHLYKFSSHKAPDPPVPATMGLTSAGESTGALPISTYTTNKAAQHAASASSGKPTTGAATLSAWVNAGSFNVARTLVQKGSGASLKRIVATQSGSLRFDMAGVGTLTAAAPSTDAWHYLVGTYDGTTLSLYIDADLVASTAAKGLVHTAGQLTSGGKVLSKRSKNPVGDQLLIEAPHFSTFAVSASDVATLFASS